ncbi:hypothetical protein KC19_6G148800 [Ceratodon purpureus]|uniref:Uncharacterized protein n=1 Tax=Ceratodon purpureus TaxID=3225 RepID=A0A8T0HG33_CERPU|nr:hypothetical protein KC19_6G148800 [Ceratodon purpureus]
MVCAEEPHLVADSMRLVFATIKIQSQLFTVANLPLHSILFMNDAAIRGFIYSALSGATSNHWASSRHFTFSIEDKQTDGKPLNLCQRGKKKDKQNGNLSSA